MRHIGKLWINLVSLVTRPSYPVPLVIWKTGKDKWESRPSSFSQFRFSRLALRTFSEFESIGWSGKSNKNVPETATL